MILPYMSKYNFKLSMWMKQLSYRLRKAKGFIYKLDIKKAYNHVNHSERWCEREDAKED